MILFENMGDFIQQIPVVLILQICGSLLLLLAALVYFAVIKPRRRKRKAQAASSQPDSDDSAPQMRGEFAPANATPAAGLPDEDMMPDLDLLLDHPELVAPPPPPAPRPAPVAPPIQAAVPAPAPAKPVVSSRSRRSRVKLRTGQTIEAEEVVAVLRDPRDGRLVVHIQGVGYRTLVDSPEVKEQFVKVMRELSDVVSQPDTPPADPAPEPGIALPMPEMPDLLAERGPAKPANRLPGDLPSYRLEEAIKPQKGGLFTSRPKYEPQPIPELNIAASIEAFLQHKLQGMPEYQGRSIHVLSAPGGGVKIEVDEQYYEAVADVDDDEIRTLLADTIQEWQARQ